jgi:hypothetical protein
LAYGIAVVMVKRLIGAVLKQKFLSGDENLCASPALWLPSASLILSAKGASRRMIQEAAPVVHSGACLETRRLAAPLLKPEGLG